MTRPNGITLRDVARRASVSAMTVSNVANGRVDQVGPEIFARVQAAISELGYKPHLRGRSLRLGRHFAVGLLIVHPDRRFLDDPFMTEVTAGMCNQLADAGYGLVVIGAASLDDIATRISHAQHLDGMAVLTHGTAAERNALYDRVTASGLPSVVIGDRLAPLAEDRASLSITDREGAATLARRLIERGARRILFLRSQPIWPMMEEREAGLRDCLAGGVEVMGCPEFDIDATTALLKARLQAGNPPDAIMGGNDILAIAALRAAGEVGLSVPGDLAVTGFNGFSLRRLAAPDLTSVQAPAYALGVSVAQALQARLDRGTFGPAAPPLSAVILEGTTG